MGGVHGNIVQRAKLGIKIFLVLVVPVLPLVLFVLLVGIDTACKGSSSGQETTADLKPLLMLLSPLLNFFTFVFTFVFFWSVSLFPLVIVVLLVSVGSASKSSNSGEAGSDLELLLVSFGPVLNFFTPALFWSFSFVTVVFIVSVGSASKSSGSCGDAGTDLKLLLVLLVLKPALLLLSLVVGVFIVA